MLKFAIIDLKSMIPEKILVKQIVFLTYLQICPFGQLDLKIADFDFFRV